MACSTNKIQHTTRASADAHAESILKKDGHLPNVYMCAECGYFHVGGGRASDRLAYHPIPIVTTPKPIFTPKKIDKGHHVALENLILNKLRTTFLPDKAIAAELNTDANLVTTLRRQNNILEYRKRATNAVIDLVVANPHRSRKEIAQVLGVKLNTVLYVAQQLGLAGQGERVHGVKHRFFGTKQSKLQKQVWADPKLRAKLSAAVKTKQWSPSEKSKARKQMLIDYNRSPEGRAKRSEWAKQQWAKWRAAKAAEAKDKKS